MLKRHIETQIRVKYVKNICKYAVLNTCKKGWNTLLKYVEIRWNIYLSDRKMCKIRWNIKFQIRWNTKVLKYRLKYVEIIEIIEINEIQSYTF